MGTHPRGVLIAIIGNCGSGKTTLAQLLCRQFGYFQLLEQHAERPFQIAFMQDRRQALPNQVDYLLLRAEQKRAFRQAAGVGVVDGGLDQDFYVFTRLFYAKGYLDQAGLDLCQRQYRLLCALLAPPDLVLKLNAPLEVLAPRPPPTRPGYRQRRRPAAHRRPAGGLAAGRPARRLADRGRRLLRRPFCLRPARPGGQNPLNQQ